MKALLIIDVQKDYFPGGRMELADSEAALQNAVGVLAAFRQKDCPVIHVQHISIKEGATFLLPGTDGVEIHPLLTPKGKEHYVVKHCPNSFYQTDLLPFIRYSGIDELVVCGMMTHMCVDTTVRAAADYEIPVTLLHDACATRDLAFQGQAVLAHQVQAAYMGALSGAFANVIAAKDLSLD